MSAAPQNVTGVNPPGGRGKATALCEVLEWDTAFFGIRVGRVKAHRLTAECVAEILDWCQQEEIRCLYFLADADDPQTVRLAEGAGFQFVDIRMTFSRDLRDLGAMSPAPRGAVIRLVRPEDVPVLCAVAARSHTTTRFASDGRFSVEQVASLYRTWIQRSCDGYADVVLVAEQAGQPVGYLTSHLDQGLAGRIGLLGVQPEVQGTGIGRELLQAGLSWFKGRGAERVSVVTQGRNVAAQRLYQRYGFLIDGVQLWYHRWL